jgi:hypothetical protein
MYLSLETQVGLYIYSYIWTLIHSLSIYIYNAKMVAPRNQNFFQESLEKKTAGPEVKQAPHPPASAHNFRARVKYCSHYVMKRGSVPVLSGSLVACSKPSWHTSALLFATVPDTPVAKHVCCMMACTMTQLCLGCLIAWAFHNFMGLLPKLPRLYASASCVNLHTA